MPLDFASHRLELRAANQSAKDGQPTLRLATKLDSSLKKNSSFIKKIRAVNADSASTILTEISSLTLEKYLSEITASLAEGILKLSKGDDLNAAVLVICALYQRFTGSFSAPLLAYMVNAAVEKDETNASLKQRTALKVIFELNVLEVASLSSDCAPDLLCEQAAKLYAKSGPSVVVITLLKDVMSYKLDSGYALPVITTFLRRFQPVINESSEIISETIQQPLQQLFRAYTARMLELRQALHAKYLKLALNNKKASIRTGMILAEHQDLVDEIVERKSFFETHSTQLCEFLSLQLPALEETREAEPEKTDSEGPKRTWWHDTKERDFYQEVPSYKVVLETFDRKKLPDSEYRSMSEGSKVNFFLSQFEALVEAKDLDLMTVIMHTYLPYNKATKNRIIRFFVEVKKIDNVNLYARFLSMNAEFFPEVIAELIEMLDRGFRSQIHFDTINFKNLAFFIELVKFKLIPSHVVFHKIRRMTLNIPGTNNVDILSVFYERCGKFLLFEPEYTATTKEMLDLLQMQSKSDRLSINEKLALSNMFLIVDSFTSSVQKQTPKVELTVMQDYIHQCVKKLVTATSHSAAFELIGDIDFTNDIEAQEALIDIYTRPEDLAGDRLNILAELFYAIGKTHRRIPLIVVEILTEKITRGLELNDYRHNVARVAQVKLIAALFNAKVLNFKSVLDLLFKILCYGHPGDFPMPTAQPAIDPKDNYFRIHLVCALFKAVNLHRVKSLGLLNSGVKTAEGFLVFLQYYSLCKVLPLPKDIEFSLSSVYTSLDEVSKHKMKRVNNLASAMQLLQQYTVGVKQSDKQKPHVKDIDGQKREGVESVDSEVSTSESSDSEDEDLDDGNSDRTVKDGVSDTDEPEHSDERERSTSEEDSDGESSDSDIVSDFDEADEEEQQAFQLRSAAARKEAQRMDNEIQNLLNASTGQSRTSAPLRMPAPSSLITQAQGEKGPPQAFKFLTKANRLHDLHLPSNNKFTDRIVMEQAAQKANRQKIISLVDNMYES